MELQRISDTIKKMADPDILHGYQKSATRIKLK